MDLLIKLGAPWIKTPQDKKHGKNGHRMTFKSPKKPYKKQPKNQIKTIKYQH
jgi:hypothetical protein